MNTRSTCDVLIIGMGIGAAAFARQLIATGASVSMLPGVGCARFNHLDGGVIDLDLLERTFGDTEAAPVHRVGPHHVFRRDQLESWAVARITDTVTVVDGFSDGRAILDENGHTIVIDESGEQSILAKRVVLTEGANPKIGMAYHLRPDFEPEDMIHYGRTVMPGCEIAEPIAGAWRTSWNMPAWYTAVPHPDGVIVGASARIENIMRAGRDGRAILADLLAGPMASRLGLTGKPGQIGMELVPLRANNRPAMVGMGTISIAFDAIGSIDARALNRFNLTLASGAELGRIMARAWPNVVDWDDAVAPLWDVFTTPGKPYHDDSETGFIEDGPASKRGLLRRLIKR